MPPYDQGKRTDRRRDQYGTNGCPSGKRAYYTRRAAKAAAKGMEGDHLRPYRCDRGCPPGTFHIGHLNPRYVGRCEEAS